MPLAATAQELEIYRSGLTDLWQALQRHEDRRALVSILQNLANRDIGRIIGLGIPSGWQSQPADEVARIKTVLLEIQRDAQKLEVFVGLDGVPPALAFLLASISMSVRGVLPDSLPARGSAVPKEERRRARKWWRFWPIGGLR